MQASQAMVEPAVTPNQLFQFQEQFSQAESSPLLNTKKEIRQRKLK